MASCELCGKSNVSTKSSKVAGTLMNICENCSGYGSSVQKEPSNFSHTFYKKVKNDDENEEVCENYGSLINSALAKKNLNLHHLAKALNIKESTLNKAMTGKLHMEISMAKRIEKFLEISLVKSMKPVNVDDYLLDEKESQVTSLGDLLKEKLKK